MEQAKLSMGRLSPKKNESGGIFAKSTYRAGYYNAVQSKYHSTKILSHSNDRKEGHNNFSLIDSLINLEFHIYY
jgi:hypothetical protein